MPSALIVQPTPRNIPGSPQGWPHGAPLRRAVLGLALLAGALTPSACRISQDQEVALGAQEARKVEAQLPMLGDPAIDDYVSTLGGAIAARTDRNDLDWRFRVIDSDVVNAFALPGGYIYVNRGLLDRADHMDELAGVLGHEVAHVTLRHSVKQIEKAQKTNAGISLVCSLTNICNSQAAQVAIDVGGSLAFARFGRQAEREADEEGFRNVVRAGIDPRGMESFFGKLLAEEERQGPQSQVGAWFADHPGTQDRIADIRRMLDSLPPDQLTRLASDDDAFRTMKRRLRSLPPAPASPPTPVP